MQPTALITGSVIHNGPSVTSHYRSFTSSFIIEWWYKWLVQWLFLTCLLGLNSFSTFHSKFGEARLSMQSPELDNQTRLSIQSFFILKTLYQNHTKFDSALPQALTIHMPSARPMRWTVLMMCEAKTERQISGMCRYSISLSVSLVTLCGTDETLQE